MNSKSKKAIIIISILASLYLLKELLCFAAFPRTDRLPIGKEAVWLSKILNQTQMYYFIENEKFATDDDLSQENLLTYTENHKYLIEVRGNAAFSQSIINNARGNLFFLKHSPVLSRIFGWGNSPTYTVSGAVFYISVEKDFQDIICISKTPGWQQLNKPYLKHGKAICAEGTAKHK